MNYPTITFTSGSSTDTTECTHVDILQDEIYEGDHDFQIELDDISVMPASCASVGTPSDAIVDILDDDGNSGMTADIEVVS